MSQYNFVFPKEHTIHQPLENSFNAAFKELADLVHSAQDRLTKDQLVEALRQAFAAGDFTCLVVNKPSPPDCITICQSVIYLPYEGYERIKNEHTRFVKLVDSILNEEQKKTLAQKLLDSDT